MDVLRSGGSCEVRDALEDSMESSAQKLIPEFSYSSQEIVMDVAKSC